MTQEIRDVIYNKTAEQLNKDDVNYIYSLLKKKSAGFNFWFAAIVSPLMGVLVPLALYLPLSLNTVATYFEVLPVTTILGTSTGLLLGGMVHSMAPSLKSLGLTRKEWKELKKSGRSKELDKLVKMYEKSDKSYIDNLNERKDEINEELKKTENHKQNLISQFEKIKEEEKAIIGEEQPQKYTQEEVAEMLKIEESLLMRRLEMLKKEQSTLQESSDSKVINEIGKKSEQNIDYMQQALKNCQEFNKDFKGATFDN